MYLKSTLFFAMVVFCVQTLSVNAQDIELGSIKITSTSEEILGKELAAQFAEQLDIDEEITWLVYMPKTYDPANPPGVLLYQIYGGINEPTGWKSVMDEKNLILIRLFVKGQVIQRKEMLLSILGPSMLQQRYNIDPSRVYTSAFQGCRAAGTIAKTYPNIIKGALYINCIPSTWRKKEPELVELMRDNRYLFISGKERSERIDVLPAIRKYRRAGIENTKFIRTARLKLTQNLKRNMLLDAIDYLDGKEEEETTDK